MANPNGRPTVPYRSRVLRIPDTGQAGQAFLSAYFEATRRAARRTDTGAEQGGPCVYLYRSADPYPAGAWRIADEAEQIPNTLHSETEGYLVIYADGNVGVGR